MLSNKEKYLLVIGKGKNYSNILNSIHKLRRYNNAEILALSWDTKLVSFLCEQGINACTIDHYSEGYYDIFGNLEKGIQLLNKIFKNNRINGISDCQDLISPYLSFFYTYRIFANLNIANTVFTKEKPQVVVLFSDDSGDFLQEAFLSFAEHLRLRTVKITTLKNRIINYLSKYRIVLSLVEFFLYNTYFIITSIASKKYSADLSTSKKILFVAPSELQFDTFNNIFNVLSESDENELLALCTSEFGYRKLKLNSKIKKIRFGDYVSISSLFILPAELFNILRQWKMFTSEISQEIFYFNGVSYKSYFYKMIGREIPLNFIKYLSILKVAKKLIEKTRPNLIITTEDPHPKVRAIQMEAKKRGITVICLPYGVPFGYKFELPFDLTDYFWASGNLMKNNLIKSGIPENKIEIVPISRFKRENVSESEVKKLRKKYNLTNNKKIVLITSNAHYDYEPGFEGPWTYNEHKKWLESVYSIAKVLPQVQLIAKPHHNPRDPIELHRSIIEKINSAIILITDKKSTPELISICDILITFVSTTAIEAILKDKPVISFNPTDREWKLPFVEYGAAVSARNEAELYSIVEQIINNKPIVEKLSVGRKKFIEGFFGECEKINRSRVEKIINKYITGTVYV